MADGDAWERLDVWLWYARVAKTRTACAQAVREGGFRLNRQPIEKPHARVRVGDILTFTSSQHAVRVWRILELGTRRGPPDEARTLYADLS